MESEGGRRRDKEKQRNREGKRKKQRERRCIAYRLLASCDEHTDVAHLHLHHLLSCSWLPASHCLPVLYPPAAFALPCAASLASCCRTVC